MHISPKFGISSGFTLIEILVGAAILSVVIAVLLAILSTSMTTWGVTSGQIEVDREGRSGHFLLMQDIDNVVMPLSTNLWPQVVSSGGRATLRFLTTKPLDYQNPQQGDVGDVCYVEYSLGDEGNSLLRNFRPSKWTYENILLSGRFPGIGSLGSGELLSTNLLRDFRDALRSRPVLYGEANTNSFVLLATNNGGQPGNILPLEGAASLTNPPVGVEVNFAVTDQTAARNLDLLLNPQYKLRNSGYFSMRFDFPSKPLR